ncbi:MAG: hypothetical protein ACK45H_05065 [Bacteroidota bacterium]
MFRLYLIACFIIGIFPQLWAQSTVTILCYKSGFEKGRLLDISKSLSTDNKKKIKEINVINYLFNKTLQPQNDNLAEKKCEITYKELVSSCSVDLCNIAEEDILRYSKGSVNKLIICGKMACSNFFIETSFLPDANSVTISKKISDEIKLNKKEKLNVIIVIPGDPSVMPSVKFSSQTIQLGQQKQVLLNPIVSGINLTYNWSPANGLSCNACPNPEAAPSKTTVYTVRVTDINGCESLPSEIEVQVNNGKQDGNDSNFENCDDCVDLHLISVDELKKLKNDAGFNNVYLQYKKASVCNPQARLALLRNTQSETVFVYDIPFKGEINPCVRSCNVRIYRDEDPNKFYEKEMDIEAIDENSGNKYVNYGFYTIRLNLSNKVASGEFPIALKEFCKTQGDKDKDYIYKMEITFYNQEKLECGTIKTGPIALSDCSIDKEAIHD